MGTDYSQKMEAWVDALQARIAKLEGFVAAYDALSPAIHSRDNDKIVRAVAAKDAARKALDSGDE